MPPPHGASRRSCAPVPNLIVRRGLSEQSEFRSPNRRDRGKGPRRATPGRPWFWVLLPKQKDRVARGRNPARTSLPSVIPDISNRGSSALLLFSLVGAASHAARPLCLLHLYPRHPMAPPQGATGRGCAPVPNPMWGQGLSEQSEFRSPNLRDRGKGPQRATPGRPWFWVLLPKQKDLVARGRNPARTSPSSVILDISNRGSSVVVFGS